MSESNPGFDLSQALDRPISHYLDDLLVPIPRKRPPDQIFLKTLKPETIYRGAVMSEETRSLVNDD